MRTSVKCCRYPFWDAVRLGFGGRSLPSCWQGRVPVGRVATVLLREHPSSYDVFSCGMQSFAHVHVPARVFFGASVYCYVLVQRLGWTAFQLFPSNLGTFFSLSIDRWVGFANALFLAPHGRTSTNFPDPSPSMHLRFDRVSTRISLSLSLPRVCETETGVEYAPSPVLPPRAFPLRYQPKRDETFGFFSSSEGKDGLGTFEDVSDRWTPFVRWGRVGGGRSETRSPGGADPHPSPPKILPRRTTHPRPK